MELLRNSGGYCDKDGMHGQEIYPTQYYPWLAQAGAGVGLVGLATLAAIEFPIALTLGGLAFAS